jgi:hypothetical protein
MERDRATGNHVLIIVTDKGPILLTDYFHRDYFSIVEDVVGTDPTKVVSATTPALSINQKHAPRSQIFPS